MLAINIFKTRNKIFLYYDSSFKEIRFTKKFGFCVTNQILIELIFESHIIIIF